MAHNCPNHTTEHRPNSRCGCQCIACLIGARNDLADDLENIGRQFDERLKKQQESYEQALDDLRRKVK